METLWGGLRNPEIRDIVRKGLVSPSSGAVKTEGGRHHKKYLSSFESLVYYFGEEWFDLKEDTERLRKKGRDDSKRSKSQPRRCDQCNKPWDTDPDGFYYIDNEAFDRLPMVAQDCHECE